MRASLAATISLVGLISYGGRIGRISDGRAFAPVLASAAGANAGRLKSWLGRREVGLRRLGQPKPAGRLKSRLGRRAVGLRRLRQPEPPRRGFGPSLPRFQPFGVHWPAGSVASVHRVRVAGDGSGDRCRASGSREGGGGEASRDERDLDCGPAIPHRTISITDYGAVGDGRTMNTAALRRAIAACEAAGGGIVRVPPGRFLTGPFALASRLNLHLDRGAALLLSNNPADYALSRRGYENGIVANECHDLAITGPGTIDGQGQPWWDQYRKRPLPGRSIAAAPDLPHRPFMIVLRRCTRVLVKNVSLVNSPSFHLVPQQCENVVIDGVRITAPSDSPNTDGIDPSGRHFLITRCFIDAGDDCIALKPSGPGDPAHPACDDFTITDCSFAHGHGLSIGGQTPGGLRNLTVRHCRFEGTAAGIRMKANRGAGGLVEALTYDDLAMKDVQTPILITSYYPAIPRMPENDPRQPVTRTTPIWRRIRIRNLTADGAAQAGRILGLPEMPVSDVLLENVKITARRGMEITHARGIRLVRCQIHAEHGPLLALHDADVE